MLHSPHSPPPKPHTPPTQTPPTAAAASTVAVVVGLEECGVGGGAAAGGVWVVVGLVEFGLLMLLMRRKRADQGRGAVEVVNVTLEECYVLRGVSP